MLLRKIHKSIQQETGLVVSVHETVCYTSWGRVYLAGSQTAKKTLPVVVGFVYRDPPEPANWTDKFVSMMDLVWLESKEIILMCDFSFDLSKANKSWTDVFSLFNLSQTVSTPTRVTPSSKNALKPVCQ